MSNRMTIEEALEKLQEKMQLTNDFTLEEILVELKKMSAYLQRNVIIAVELTKGQEVLPANDPTSVLENANQQLQQANARIKQVTTLQQKPASINPIFGTVQQQQSQALPAVKKIIQDIKQIIFNLRQLPANVQQNFLDDTALNQAGGQPLEKVIANREQLGVNPDFRWRKSMDSKETDQIAVQTDSVEQQSQAVEQQMDQQVAEQQTSSSAPKPFLTRPVAAGK